MAEPIAVPTVAEAGAAPEKRVDGFAFAAAAPDGGKSELTDETKEPFRRALLRLEQMIESESEALQRNELHRLAEWSRVKSLGLLELNRAVVGARIFNGADLDSEAQSQLASLHAALERNLAALHTRLRAVRHVAAIIARAIEEHESDGTYTFRRTSAGETR